jgi:hypothetical protein
MYEAKVKTPVSGIYPIHKWLDETMKALPEAQRDYTWMRIGVQEVLVRHPNPLVKADWKPVRIPERGSRIQFSVMINRRQHNGHRRSSSTDYGSNLSWFTHFSHVSMGLDLMDIDLNIAPLDIAKPIWPFKIWGIDITGLAMVERPDLLKTCVRTGIANAKAYGCGFFRFNVN